jgi:hypothetical protein
MDILEGLSMMEQGYKIKKESWVNNFIYINENGDIVYQDGCMYYEKMNLDDVWQVIND